MLNTVTFGFFIMKKLLDLAHERLVNIPGGHEIWINIHGWQPNPISVHLCTKINSLLM